MAGWGTGWGAGSRGRGGGGDIVAPRVFGFTPVAGTPITATTSIDFNVGDETALRRVIVMAYYDAIKTTEVIYDGDAFTPEFARGSTVTPASFPAESPPLVGYSFHIVRLHGWKSTPRIRVSPVDRGGNEPT